MYTVQRALWGVCSLNTAVEGETWWAAIDTSLNHLLRVWENEGMREAVAPIRRLEKVCLMVDLTSAMQREVERGLSIMKDDESSKVHV